jgi:hypothetical protein
MSVKPEMAFDVCWDVYRGAREVMESKRGLAPHERARHFLGLSERGWVNWSEEIRRRCGAEILRRGMFPPRKYFNGGE